MTSKRMGVERILLAGRQPRIIRALYGAFFLFGEERKTSIKLTLRYSRIFKIRDISNSEPKMVIVTYTKQRSVILCKLNFAYLI